MRLSLKTKVSASVVLIIVVISTISTYLLTSNLRSSIEKNLIARGDALSYSLAKAAEEGLKEENLDLIKKASSIVYAEDVTLVQVYSTAWGTIDAYPIEKLNVPPEPEAIEHFKNSDSPLYKKIENAYDFYMPIIFKIQEDSPGISIGFVRLTLSLAPVQKELKRTLAANIIASVVITIIIIVAINLLFNRFVLNPVARLRKSVLRFKNGKAPESVPIKSHDEVGELISAFNQMSETIIKDAYEIKKAEKVIHDAIQDWENTFDTITDMITIHDKDFNIIRANKSAKKILGLPFLRDIKTKCYEYYHGTEKPPENCPSCQCLKTMQPATVEMFEPHLNKFIEIRAIPRFDKDNNLIGIIHVIRDISEREKIEDELKKKIEELERFYDMAVGRELKMKELKTEIERLTTEISRYKTKVV